jgi:hypothetical protein
MFILKTGILKIDIAPVKSSYKRTCELDFKNYQLFLFFPNFSLAESY